MFLLAPWHAGFLSSLLLDDLLFTLGVCLDLSQALHALDSYTYQLERLVGIQVLGISWNTTGSRTEYEVVLLAMSLQALDCVPRSH